MSAIALGGAIGEFLNASALLRRALAEKTGRFLPKDDRGRHSEENHEDPECATAAFSHSAIVTPLRDTRPQ